MASHVFISYARTDADYCRLLERSMKDHGLACWYDRDVPPNGRWNEEIERALANCAAFVVLRSRSSADSTWVKREILYAEQMNKAFFVIALDDSRFFEIQDRQAVFPEDGRPPGEEWFSELARTVDEAAAAAFKPQVEAVFGKDDHPLAVAWSPSDGRIATAGRSRRTQLWDVRQTDAALVVALAQSLLVPKEEGASATALVSWSPDGRGLVTGVNDGSLRVWTMDGDSAPQLRLKVHAASSTEDQGRDVRVAAWSPDGTQLAFVGRFGGAHICRLGINSVIQAVDLVGYQGQITALSWAPDGKYLVSGHQNGSIMQFNAATGQPHGEPILAHPETRINGMAWSSRSVPTHLATSGDNGTLALWEWDHQSSTVRRGEPGDLRQQHRNSIWGLAWSRDGRFLATAGGDQMVRVWDRVKGIDGSIKHPGRVWGVTWSPDGRRLATACDDGAARVWSLWPGAEPTLGLAARPAL